ncbi:MAG: hypothetical protein Q8Q09_26410 [Deltaproteobacteria bacterium]|nr:hypothetical protein [Deltaproteobacteria bacterium]
MNSTNLVQLCLLSVAGAASCAPQPADLASAAQGATELRAQATVARSVSAIARDRRENNIPNARRLEVLNGHYNPTTGQLTFRTADDSELPTGGRPLNGYGVLGSGLVTFTTTSSGIAPSAVGGVACGAGKLCAVVSVENSGSGRVLENVWVEVNGLTAGVNVANGSTLTTSYPSTAGNAGGWSYNTLGVGASAATRWEFGNGATVEFNFQVSVWATFLRTSYDTPSEGPVTAANNDPLANAAWSDTAPVWRDACLMAGMTRVMTSQSSPAEEFGVVQPFPFTTYDLTVDPSTFQWNISSTGILSLNSIGIAPPLGASTLPDSSAAFDYSIAPFWENLTTGTEGVCYAQDPTSSSPTRRFVITWKDATIVGRPNSRMTFSAVLRETNDAVFFVYHRWSDNALATVCGSSNQSRGNTAAAGVQGFDVNGNSTVDSVGEARLSRLAGASSFILPIRFGNCLSGTGVWNQQGYFHRFSAAVANP